MNSEFWSFTQWDFFDKKIKINIKAYSDWLKTLLKSEIRDSMWWTGQLTLLDPGGGLARPPLGVISCHSVEDAPTNSKFLDFSQLHPYFHLVKSFFTFFCNFYKKITVKFFFRPKKERFFDENGQKPFFLKNIVIFCFNYVISMLWEFFWGALHICRSKIDDVEGLIKSMSESRSN